MGRFLLLFFLCSLLTVSAASARTWAVFPDSTGDAPTIQAGIDSASAGDTVMVMSGTYYEHDISIKSGTYLTSETGVRDCVTIDADSLGRVFYLTEVDSTTHIVGFTALNGSATAGGGMYCSGSNARFTECSLEHNTVVNSGDSRGGGVYLVDSSPIFTDCAFSWNTVSCDALPGQWVVGEGGGAYSLRGAPRFVDCTFSHNSAFDCGGGNGGGGVACSGGGPVFEACVLDSNTSGGAYVDGNTAAVFAGCTFRDNSAASGMVCGGLLCRSDDAIIADCLFEGNSSSQGGALYCRYGSPMVTGCHFFDNNGGCAGGGAFVEDLSSPAFIGCVFAGNQAPGAPSGYGGGGLFIRDDSSVELVGCTFSANSTVGRGGGVYCGNDSYVSLDRCIVAFSGDGEAVYWDGTGVEPVLSCCDLYGNADGDWIGSIASQLGVGGNISGDPLFVDAGGYDFHLQTGSPCLDEDECGIIGTFGWVCGFDLVSVLDVPGDGGGFVDVTWSRLCFDSTGSDTTVHSYSIWRRTEPGYDTGEAATSQIPAVLAAPPGTWECVDSVAADGREVYTRPCSSLCDSTDDGSCWTAFWVKAHCSGPSLEFTTMSDSGYSIWDLCDSWTDVTTSILGDVGPGSGLAWVDYDDDGDLDIHFTNRTTTENVLLRNDDLSAGGFVDATPPALADPANSRGCPWGDYDNDGDPDLYVSNKGANKLLRNDGGGNFVDVTTSPLDDAGTGQSAAWFDYDNDGDLDIYLVNNGGNKLLRNDSAVVFTDVTSGALGDSSWGVGLGLADYDGDGDMDIYIANYDGANLFLENQGGGVFADVTTPVLECALASYGAAWGDYDNDGDLDLYVTNEGSNNLLRNDGGTFTDVSASPVDDSATGRSAAWGDCDNDGDLDLYLVNDGVNRIFRNIGGGGFQEADGICTPLKNDMIGFSTGWADYDKDGDLDIYLVNDGANKLFRNESEPGNHWLEVDPVGTVSNTSAIGVRVRIVAGGTTQMREIGGASGFASQGPLTAWFGLGAECTVDTVEITWPASGTIQTITGITCDQTLEVIEDPLSGVPDREEVPPAFKLYANRPNPFTAETVIRYDLPGRSHVGLAIYDVSGRSVCTLLDGEYRDPGQHVAHWDGRNSDGQPAAPGIYFCRFTAGPYTRIQRLVLLK